MWSCWQLQPRPQQQQQRSTSRDYVREPPTVDPRLRWAGTGLVKLYINKLKSIRGLYLYAL